MASPEQWYLVTLLKNEQIYNQIVNIVVKIIFPFPQLTLKEESITAVVGIKVSTSSRNFFNVNFYVFPPIKRTIELSFHRSYVHLFIFLFFLQLVLLFICFLKT